jgi:membrane AbrB-like protein
MILAGGAFGGDERRISLSHGARIFIAVFSLSFGYRWLGGYQPVASAGTVVAQAGLSAADWLLLSATGVAGFALARVLRVPAYALVGPMVLSAFLHGAGITHSRPPFWLVALAQIVVGSMVGARFDGVRAREVVSAVLLAAVATALLLLVAVAFGWLVNWSLDIPFAATLLAFAPGGLAEMSLIALALDIDAAYVSSHHVVRIVLIVVAAPIVFRLFGGQR